MKPFPLTAIEEISASILPVLCRVACNVSVVPTVTFPKFNEVGLGIKVTEDASAVALQEICREESLVALLIILIVPLAEPGPVGFSEAVRLALLPAARVNGAEIPETVSPAPEAVTEDTVTEELPEFAILMVCVVAVPVGTLPNTTLGGVAVRVEPVEVAVVPVPLQAISSVELEAVLLMVNAPDAFPAEAGLNVAAKLALEPADNFRGSETPASEIPEPEADIAEIVMLEEPEFFS